MATKKQKIHAIIHTAALTAGGVGSGLAQIPGADMPILMALQTAMIVAIGAEYDCAITKSNAKSILLTFPAGYGGRALSQYLTGWIPGLSNAINASTAMVMTETIGWVRIPDENSQPSGGKTATIPMGKRPAFRLECGHHSGENGQYKLRV